jgi:hypothetical protein
MMRVAGRSMLPQYGLAAAARDERAAAAAHPMGDLPAGEHERGAPGGAGPSKSAAWPPW